MPSTPITEKDEDLDVLVLDRNLFGCSLCDYTSKFKQNVKFHTVTHTKVKAHPCSYCGMLFTQKSSMRRHTRSVHTKESEHQCPLCYQTFTLRSSLTRHHATVHLQLKPFKCLICAKKFPKKGALKYHVQLHSKKVEYVDV